MTYRFRSKASGDVLMLEADGAALLQVIGIAPAAQGILEPQRMPAALRAVEEALVRDEARSSDPVAGTDEEDEDAVSQRQRAWPLLEMMKRAHEAGEPIVWGI